MATEYRRIQNLIYTAAEWRVNNPILLPGELGVESDTRKFKFGNGSAWNNTEYAGTEVDLTNYYTKGETDNKFATGQMLNNLSSDLNRKIDEKADKTEIPSLDEYYTKEDIDGKVQAIDNAIATKADQEEVNNRFSSVDEYLSYLQTAVESKADVSELEYYVLKGDYEVKVQAIDNAIATKADQEEVNNRFGSVDEYLEQLHSEIENKADASAIPTNTSDLNNDSDYTTNEALEGAKQALQEAIDTKVDTTTYEGKINEIEAEIGDRYTKSEVDIKVNEAKGETGNVETKVDTHIADNVKHITAAERTSWNSKTTMSEVEAKGYDTVNSVNGKIDAAKVVLQQSIDTKASDDDFAAHKGNDIIHITEDERTSWNEKATMAEVEAKDYATHTELAEVENKIPTNTEVWSFEMEDGTIITKEVYLK